MFLVDHGGGGAETLPYRFAEFLAHRTQFLPLLVELLQGAEGAHDILLLSEVFSLLAEVLLRFEVLLEVEVAELLVDFYIVVEFLHIVLVGVVQVLDLGLRHGADGTPAVLDLAEAGEGLVEVFAGFDEGLEVFDHGELGLVVFFLVLLEFLGVSGTSYLILAVKILESAFDLGEGIDGDGLVGRRFGIFSRFGGLFEARGDLLFAQVLVECRLEGFGMLVELLHVLAFNQALERVDNLLETLVRKIRLLVFRFFCGFRFGFGRRHGRGFHLCFHLGLRLGFDNFFLYFYGLFLDGSNRVQIFTHDFTCFNSSLQI